MAAQLIVALDLPRKEDALVLARELQGAVPWCKVGMELFTLAGPDIIRELHDLGFHVFLDMKFYDIPHTVAQAVKAAAAALTSFGPGEMPGISADPSDFALELAGKARGWGLDGVVCSGHEAARIKASCQGLRCLCPGIRPAGADTDDQQRIMTPARAVQAGADFLVVGRPILKAPSPAEAARAIQAEMKAAV